MNIALFAAGGSGTRMGGAVPKQNLELGGTPIYRITVERFNSFSCIDAIIFAGKADFLDDYRSGLKDLSKVIGVIEGGQTRDETVRNALRYIQSYNPEIVAIHDIVRPFVSEQAVEHSITAAREYGAAVVCIPSVDTLFEVENGAVQMIPDRSRMWQVQTPQSFRYDLIVKAHEAFLKRGGTTTDDARLVLDLGHPVHVVQGSKENFKITEPFDMEMAEVQLSRYR